MKILKILFFVCLSNVLFMETNVMGMGNIFPDGEPINFSPNKILSDPKDRVFPLEPGIYLDLESFGGESLSEEIKKHLSPAEQSLLLAKSYIPVLPEDDKEPDQLKKLENCYSLVDGKDTMTWGFEKISDDFYLVESYEGPYKEQGTEVEVQYFLAEVKNNHVYIILYFANDEFEKWATSLNMFNRIRYGVKIEEKGDRKTANFSTTKAIKVFYRENIEIFTAAMSSFNSSGDDVIDKVWILPLMVSSSEVAAYNDKMALSRKIKTLKEKMKAEEDKIKAEEEKKIAEQKQKEEKEKNDGVIRYAFGRKLGEIHAADIDAVTYHNVTNLVEKSKYFQDYYEVSTPETHQVLSIYGVSENLSAKACKTNAMEVMEILSAKYGEPLDDVPVEGVSWISKQSAINNSFLYFKRIEQRKNNKLIELVCVTDSDQIKKKKSEHQTDGCQLDENLFDKSIADSKDLRLELSKYSLYSRYSKDSSYSTYKNYVIPFWLLGDNYLYPAPVPSLSSSYNRNYRKCGLDKKNDIFRLFIRYSDTAIEGIINKEKKNIKREKENIEKNKIINSSDANGL